jgi:site-specific recombinase XerD
VPGSDADWILQGREGLRLTAIAKPLRDVLRWAGLYEKGTLAHSFGHSVATALLGSGVAIETLRDWLGLQQVTTTALYLHASDERKRKAARQLRLVS